MSERTDMMVSQVVDEVLYTRLIEMQGLAEAQGATQEAALRYIGILVMD